jgi:CBS domain-containing protein
MRINAVVAAKASREIVTISPAATVRELITLLAQHNIGAAMVSTDRSTLVGIVSERDVVRRLNDGDAVLDGLVSDIMTTVVHTATPDSTLDEVRSMMTEGRIRHVPVLEDGHLAGIVSIGDILKSHIDQVEFERDQLDSYVHQT